MEIVEQIMNHYTEATDDSYIEKKETAMVWHYEVADKDFGSDQAKKLLDHLEHVLANEPVAVKHGQYIVEVKPQVPIHKLYRILEPSNIKFIAINNMSLATIVGCQ